MNSPDFVDEVLTTVADIQRGLTLCAGRDGARSDTIVCVFPGYRLKLQSKRLCCQEPNRECLAC